MGAAPLGEREAAWCVHAQRGGGTVWAPRQGNQGRGTPMLGRSARQCALPRGCCGGHGRYLFGVGQTLFAFRMRLSVQQSIKK